ncbi:response regulator [Halovivax gelatinilyticus]|uniref:response regulator n=1 Tax=Halovivax gelatinilyticus TaxID=2961597 RepID=UPI0020CA986C|nr:response regulator [Halovivax gelatinilyticus]
MTVSDSPVIAIVEDEPAVAESYELWLDDEYEIRRAHDGAEALEVIDDSVDVVLLDRMMPKLSGAEVLQEIREREVDCRVAMVTAVEPDLDVIEMGFDAYVTKPPERDDLLETVRTLVERGSLSDDLQEYHSLLARRGALEAEQSAESLAESEPYQELLERIEAKRLDVDEGLGDMGSDVEFVSAVREIDADSDLFDGDGPETADTSETTDD